jgi:drug/metabolite transporter (DMT)-like permease
LAPKDAMTWLMASLCAAGFLGAYELCNKHAVRGNAVLPVLFLSTLCSASIWTALLLFDVLKPGVLPARFVTDHLTAAQHIELLLKSAIVTASWVCTYFAVKHLPVSITSPVASTSPLFTLAGGLLIFLERPSHLQMLGITVTLGSFVGLSFAGHAEGVDFRKNGWVRLMLLGTVLNATSALYDKFLLGRKCYSAATVQAWFSIYLVVLFLPLAVGWKCRWWARGKFHWRWSIPGIALALLIADFLYFTALRDPAALISVVSSIRRGSVLVTFAGGLLLFGEGNGWRKLPAILGLLAGIWLIVLG